MEGRPLYRRFLVALAEARQAEVTPLTLNVYSKAIKDFEQVDVEHAISVIATAERRDGETAFPSLGKLLTLIKMNRERRIGHKAQEARDRQSQYVREHPEEFTNLKEIAEGLAILTKARRAGDDYPVPARDATKQEFNDYLRHFGIPL